MVPSELLDIVQSSKLTTVLAGELQWILQTAVASTTLTYGTQPNTLCTNSLELVWRYLNSHGRLAQTASVIPRQRERASIEHHYT